MKQTSPNPLQPQREGAESATATVAIADQPYSSEIRVALDRVLGLV